MKVKIELEEKDAIYLKELMQNPFKIDYGQGEVTEVDQEFMKRIFYAIPRIKIIYDYPLEANYESLK